MKRSQDRQLPSLCTGTILGAHSSLPRNCWRCLVGFSKAGSTKLPPKSIGGGQGLLLSPSVLLSSPGSWTLRENPCLNSHGSRRLSWASVGPCRRQLSLQPRGPLRNTGCISGAPQLRHPVTAESLLPPSLASAEPHCLYSPTSSSILQAPCLRWTLHTKEAKKASLTGQSNTGPSGGPT